MIFFFLFLLKNFIIGIQWNQPAEPILISTRNIFSTYAGGNHWNSLREAIITRMVMLNVLKISNTLFHTILAQNFLFMQCFLEY